MKSFEELSRPDNEHWSQNYGSPGTPDLCAGLPPTHPICSGTGPGNANPPPLTPVPEPGTWLTLALGLVAIALYRRCFSSPGQK